MTWKPMDPFDPDDTTASNTSSLHESSNGLGKAILAIHGTAPKKLGTDDASISVSSFSEAGFMADVSEGDVTSASEASDYYSESGGPSSSLLAAHPEQPRSKRKVKRKAGQKKKSTTAATTSKEGKPRKKRPTKKKASTDQPALQQQFNMSKELAGTRMEDFMTDSQTEGETDNDNNNNTRPKPARRKRKVKRSISYNPSSSSKVLADSSKNNSQTARRGGADTDTEKQKRKGSVAKKKPATLDAEKPKKVKRKSSTKGGKPTTTSAPPSTRAVPAPAKKKDKLDDEKSFAEESFNDSHSIQSELLSPLAPPPQGIKPKLITMEQSTTSLEKEASLDLAKHGAADKGHNKNRELMMDAFSKSMLNNAGTASHRGRSLSPETKRREKAQETTTEEEATKPKSKPRRMKSQADGTITDNACTKKPIRRTKSDGDPGGVPVPKRTRTPSRDRKSRTPSRDRKSRTPSRDRKSRTPSRDRKSRTPSRDRKSQRQPPKTADNKKMAKQRSQSLNLAAHPAIAKNNRNARRRRVPASETSPGGTSKISISVSLNTMDQSVQSMPSNVPRDGVARRASASMAPPLRAKSTEGKVTGKKRTSAVSNKSTVTKPTAAATRKKKAGSTNRRPSGPKTNAFKPTTTASKKANNETKTKNASSELDEDESILSVAESSKADSLLSGHIARDSTGRNNLNLNPVPSAQKKKANGKVISPFSTRANSEDEGGMVDEEDDDVYSKSEASTIMSGASSMSGRNKSATSTGKSLKRLSNNGPPKRNSNHLISSYFDRDEESGGESMANSGESVSGSMGGSLLTDYSSSDNESTVKSRTAPFGSGSSALLRSSSSDMSVSTKQTRMTISPFSAHAGNVPSNHTTTTLLATDHTTAPLIPDSDDEESESFHEEPPAPISSKVEEGPPSTPLAPPKEKLSKGSAPLAVLLETPKVKVKPKQPKIVLPVSTPKKESSKKKIKPKQPKIVLPVSTPKKESSKKIEDDDEFADPVPKKKEVASKPKASIWEALCCRSASAVAT